MNATGIQRLSGIGPYEFEGLIGTGSSGVVFRSRDSEGGPVAVKVLHPHLVDQDFRRRFERESQVRIDHPNVVQVLDTGVAEDGSLFIVFELLEGESVEAMLKDGPLDAGQVVDIGVQACRGLAVAHQRGIIHRDLKPANLFRRRDGTIKLLDFGMALVSNRATRLTVGNAILGTPAYLSPEQARGDHDLDPQTDVWALGAILYEALSGRLPFGRDSVFATIVAIRMDKLVPLAACAPTVPPGLAACVERALAKEKAKRWPSAKVFSRALSEADLTPGGALPTRSENGLIAAGENRVVAILLADGVRESSLIEAAVVRRGGTFVSLVYDRAIGVFGGDTWEGDEVVRATEAALECRRGTDWVAVSSGRAEAHGQAISGSALQSAESGCAARLIGVAMDAETARSLHGRFALREVSSRLKEITGATILWEPASDPGLGHRILGREAELAQVRRALETVNDEWRALAIVVRGVPGIGKSRLFREIESLIRGFDFEEPLQSFTARAEPHQRETALSLVRMLLDDRLHLDPVALAGDDPTASAVEARRRAVVELAYEALGDDERAEGCAEFLGELLGLPMPSSPALDAARRDPQLMSDRLRLAVQDFFEALCEQGPVALLLEDLHWADSASVDLLEDLFDRLSEAALLVVGTVRPGIDQTLFGRGEVVQLRLRGLTSPDVASLARATLKKPLPDSLVRAITKHTSGNPLFVEQIVRALDEKGSLDGDLSTFPMPISVQAAVQSRLDHLPPDEKTLCKLAAVLGRAFFPDEVEALGLVGAEPLLNSLCRRNILVARGRSRLGRGRRYRFKTSLIAEVAYRMLADEFRVGLHHRAAAYLAALPDSDDEEVAGHCERGGDLAQAARHYREAALTAAQRGDTQTVLRCSARALELGLPEAWRFGLHMARADALRFHRRREDHWRELEAAAEYAANDVERARVETERASWLARSGRSEEAQATALAAVVAARQAGHAEALVVALSNQVTALAYAGQLAEAEHALSELSGLAGGLRPQVQAQAASARAQLASARGDLSERRLAFEESVHLYGEAGDIRRAAGAECNLADAHNRFGAYAEAEAELHAAIEGCRRVGNRLMEGYALLNLSYSLGMLEQHERALSALRETRALADDMGEARLAIAAEIYRSRVLVDSGELALATEVADQVTKQAEEAGLPSLAVLALTQAARAYLESGRPEDALARSERAIALRDELGSIEEDEMEVFLVHARALSRAGRGDEARRVVARGIERLQELSERITDPDWRERFLEDVAAHRELAERAREWRDPPGGHSGSPKHA